MRTDLSWRPFLLLLSLSLAACPTQSENRDDDDASDDDDSGAGDDDDTTVGDDDDSASATAPGLALLPSAPGTSDDLTVVVQVPAITADGTAYLDYRVAWYLDNGAQPDLDGLWTLPSSATTRGDDWTAEVVPVGTDGVDGPSSVITVTIENSLPSVAAVMATPLDPEPTDSITATPQGWSDADGDTESYQYTWYVNGSEVSGSPTSVLNPAAFVMGDEVWAVLTPYDGTATGTPVESNHLVIGNGSPTVAGVTLDPTAGDETTVFTCLPSGWSDPDGDPEGYLYQWYVDGFASEQTATLDGVDFDRGQAIWCVVTPFDGTVGGPTVSSTPVIVDNALPTLTSADIDPVGATSLDTLSVVPVGGADPDGDAVTYYVEWFVAGAFASAGDTLSGAFARGDDVYASVTPDDGTDVGAAVVTPTITIANALPTADSVSIVANVDLLLFTANPVGFYDVDGDPEGWSYSWAVNGVAMGSDSPVFTPGNLATGDVVEVSVSPDDGFGLGTPVTASTAVSPLLNVTPDPYSYGSLEVGCAVSADFILTNDGLTDLTLDSVSLTDVGGTGELSLATAVGTGTVLAPGASLTVTVDYDVLDTTPASADLVIVSDDPTAPTFTVYVDGEAHFGPTLSESFTGNGGAAFVLSGTVVEASIAVTVDGASVTTWAFDSGTSTLTFDAGSEPATGADIEVSYSAPGTNCTPNEGPTAVATVTAVTNECSPVVVSGAASTDPDGDDLVWTWSLESVPAGSVLTTADLVLAGPDSVLFEADVAGDYVIGLVVTDEWGLDSTLTTVTATVAAGTDPNNVAPDVDLGADVLVSISRTCSTNSYGVVSCQSCNPDGSIDIGSTFDTDSLTLAYGWSIVATNGEVLSVSTDGTSATIDVPTQSSSSYGQVNTGTVDVTLVATDCEGASDSQTIQYVWECTW